MARGNSLGSATIQLELEYAKVSKGIDQVNKKLGGFQKGLKRMSGALKGVFAVGSVYAFSRALNSTLSELDKIGKTAAKIGVTTDALQELRFAAEQSGVNVQALDMGLQRFVRRTAEAAKGTGVLKDEFKALGISLKNSDGSLRSVEEVLGDYADAIANAEDSQEQLRLAFKAFDSEGAALVNLFRNGKIGVEELRQELRDLGGVIDSNLIAKAESANDAMNRVSKAMGGTFKTALASLAPIIERVANWIVELTKRWRAFFEGTIPLAELSISQLQKQSERAASDVEKWTKAIEEHEEKVKTMAGAYTTSGSELEYLKKMLAESQERFKKVNEEMDIAERTGRALTDTSSGLGEALGEVGEGGEEAAAGLKTLSQVLGGPASSAINEFRAAWDGLYSQMEGRYKASMSDVLGLWDKLGKAIPGVGDSAKEAIDKGTTALFDMKEAVLDVQRSLQQGFSDLFYDIFSGKGISSVKDFAKRVLDIFKRLFADIAAAWVASKIFGGTINIGGIGGLISGGGVGGAVGQGTGVAGSIASSGIGKAISTGLTKIGTAIKGIFTSATSAGAFGAGAGVNPATMVGGLGGKGFAAGLGGLAIPAAIFGGVALGTSALASADAKEIAKYTSRYQSNFGQMAPEGLGRGGSFLGAFENGAGAVDEMYVAVSQQLNKALEQTGLIVRSLNLRFEESGNPVRRLIGDVDAVKTALTGAKVRGFEFAGSLETAIEKGNGLRVSIEGDAEVIKQKLEEATAAGVGGFKDLEVTGSGVSALLTGDIAQWNKVLQEFVNSAVASAVSGVRSLGGAAASATGRFMDLASAASQVSISGGRAAQVDPSRNLPKFADGGIATSPSIFGDRGPEAAIPLKNGSVPVTINGGMSNADTNRLLGENNRLLRRIERKPSGRLI